MPAAIAGTSALMNPRSLQTRDRWLERQVSELLACDDRIKGLDVTVRFDGGVAHVDGRVPDEVVRSRVRDAVTSLRGVYAFWDGLLVGEQERLRVVDLGCGATKQRPPSVGIDLFPAPGVDVLADFRQGLPLQDASVDRIYAVHVLEHLIELVPLMNELHRVLAPGGVLHAMSPHWKAINAVADPTHVRFFDVQTFKYFCGPHAGTSTWWPHLVGYDGDNVFADLTPVRPGDPLPSDEQLGLFFD
ncbi:MAG: methyltransferase domain-containing protein [Actinomycetota bacterium]|nr:methyltransferase domain-containing protein [Actinomycetota bacterium]